jgi:hypothetical protein
MHQRRLRHSKDLLARQVTNAHLKMQFAPGVSLHSAGSIRQADATHRHGADGLPLCFLSAPKNPETSHMK